MSEFKKGQEYYRQGGKVFGRYGTFKMEFLSGYNFEERVSRCNYDKLSWNKDHKYKRL